MKRLQDYIIESSSESKTFTFNFDGITGGEDIVKSLSDDENVTVDGNKVTVTIKKDVNIETVQDILQQGIQAARKEQKSISDETYGQKTAKLEKTLGEMNNYLDEVNNPEDEENDKDDKDKNKDKDEE